MKALRSLFSESSDGFEGAIDIRFVRHGEAMSNMDPTVMPGLAIPAPLTRVGRLQARAYGLVLADEDFVPDAVYYSPARRAEETMDLSLDQAGLTGALRIPDKRLLERSVGLWTGQKVKLIMTKAQRDLMRAFGDDFRPPEGESYNDGARRIMDWLNSNLPEFRAPDGPKKILAYTHGDILRGLIAHLHPSRTARAEWISVPHVSTTRVVRESGKWVLASAAYPSVVSMET